jgi:uncharacterized membrane protein YkgB
MFLDWTLFVIYIGQDGYWWRFPGISHQSCTVHLYGLDRKCHHHAGLSMHNPECSAPLWVTCSESATDACTLLYTILCILVNFLVIFVLSVVQSTKFCHIEGENIGLFPFRYNEIPLYNCYIYNEEGVGQPLQYKCTDTAQRIESEMRRDRCFLLLYGRISYFERQKVQRSQENLPKDKEWYTDPGSYQFTIRTKSKRTKRE